MNNDNSSSIALLRQSAVNIFKTGIAAADPYLAVKRNIALVNERLSINANDRNVNRSGAWSKIHLIAFGKAACPMLQAALDTVAPNYAIGGALAVTNYENVQPISGIEVVGAGHPLPDESGHAAAIQCAEIAKYAKQSELVLVLVSGGGSALIPYPVNPVSLPDKIHTTELLLVSGATINEINCVRKHLSQLKGGGLARLTMPADLHALILSDVLGDDVSTIASGPTVPDQTTFKDAVNILKNRSIWQHIPDSAKCYLEQGKQGQQPETPKADENCFVNTKYTIIGSNRLSVDAVTLAAREQGYETVLFSDKLTGEASEQALNLLTFAKMQVNRTLGKPLAILAGGETTVTLKGNGKGGRNQEMALAFALQAQQQGLAGDWVFLSGGTDGRDGPTEAAGGIVDSGTIQRMINSGRDPAKLLENNDSFTALQASHDLLLTGTTSTNVADLQILLIQP